ncbi:hypothetical protein SEUCBS139899_002341 [Sporothrix eucalyptigena]|uniref:Bola-like protein n=1 Tax=Sporothrix eucalyptigena TaxID=1812306 RepID=A0ABP0BUR6_9PEZI
MICSACRIARQQLVARRAATASFPVFSITTARRGFVAATSAPVLSRRTTARAVPVLHTLRAYSAAVAQASSSSTTPPPIPKPDFLDEAESHIWDLLVAAFEPHELSVRDISGGCGSMYGIEISSERFRGANMLKQQRMVNAALGDLIKGWHGVQLKTRVPEA